MILSALSLLLIAMLFGMIIAWGWAFQRMGRGLPLAPERPIRPPPTARWGAGTVLIVAALFLGTNIVLGEGYLALRAPSGHDRAGIQAGAKAAPGGPKTERAAHEAKSLTPLEKISLTCAANLAFCVLGLPLLRKASNVGPSNLGLFVEEWPRQVWLGVVAALLATPTTYAIQMIATSIWKVREHPVQEMMMDQSTLKVAALALLATVVLAPIVEETMFRGVLQRWLTRLFDPTPRTAADVTAALPGDEPGAQLAIVATSIVFAAMHSAQWPDPIALFVFSLVLGGLYQKTGSLLAAMVAHATFNGFSTLLLIAQLPTHHIKG